MGMVSIINTTPYKEQPIPEVGKEYHIFDDGKVKPTRHWTARITELILFSDCTDEKVIDAWKSDVEECPWLYSETTDYIVKAEAPEYNREDALYFVRTTDGGWFSLDYPNWFSSARLDIDSSLYNKMQELLQEAK